MTEPTKEIRISEAKLNQFFAMNRDPPDAEKQEIYWSGFEDGARALDAFIEKHGEVVVE